MKIKKVLAWTLIVLIALAILVSAFSVQFSDGGSAWTTFLGVILIIAAPWLSILTLMEK
jgi:hypothetical protein